MKNFQRRTWAEINLDHIAHNFKLIQATAGTKICCVVKADGYGHGAEFLAREYQRLGAAFFGVSNIDEALQLRRGGIQTPILIFGYTPPADAIVLSENNVSQCVYSSAYARELSENAEKAGAQVKMHVKIDTGMSRLGFYFQNPQRDGSAVEEIQQVCALPGLEAEGIFTHFAVSDEGTNEFTRHQFHCFSAMIEALGERGIHFPFRHCANSGAIVDFPETHLDMVRAGIILYGLSPSADIRNQLEL
ncbi:MAG: alanine racemase, partial [Oscillospiraceae bacterium]